MFGFIKAFTEAINLIKTLARLIKHWLYLKRKSDIAHDIEKAEKEKNTEDLQNDIGKMLD